MLILSSAETKRQNKKSSDESVQSSLGQSLYRESAFRQPKEGLKLNFIFWLLAPVFGFFVAFWIFPSSEKTQSVSSNESLVNPPRKIEAVAALGQLSPLGNVRRLAAPTGAFGGTPRISALYVSEGQQVKAGEVLATFDNRPQVLSDIAGVRARLSTLEINIKLKSKEVSRYLKTSKEGASSLVLLEGKQEELAIYKGQRDEALAELAGLKNDLFDSQLRSPIGGVILRIISRVGERPGQEGVLEVGANQSMEALIEVYESDINRIKVGQSATLTSENGGFDGVLAGTVRQISPQVRQRRVLSTDPTGDADARVVEVWVRLAPASAELVSDLTGMKVIARFIP